MFESNLVNKLGDYYEWEDNNTTLSIKVNNVKSVAILDSEAGIVIATKTMWEAWGKPTLTRIRMKLQLTHGGLSNHP